MTIGDKIKLLRKSKGMTQSELGERLGVKKNAVSKWECGRVEDIPAGKIKMMAEIFDVPTSYLIDDKEKLTEGELVLPSDLSEDKLWIINKILNCDEKELKRIEEISFTNRYP